MSLLRPRARGTAGFSWCAQWWEHPEAVLRLEAVWRAYEALRHDPATGISVWVRDHVDPHLGKLTADGGPVGTCRADEHRNPPPPLPIADPPEDWWTEADSGLRQPGNSHPEGTI